MHRTLVPPGVQLYTDGSGRHECGRALKDLLACVTELQNHEACCGEDRSGIAEFYRALVGGEITYTDDD